MAGALQSYKLCHVFQILAEHELIAARDHRHIAHAESEQLFAPARIIQDVDRDEVDLFFRKKLFRSEAATSSRLGEENELVSDGAHVCVNPDGVGESSLLPAQRTRQAGSAG